MFALLLCVTQATADTLLAVQVAYRHGASYPLYCNY